MSSGSERTATVLDAEGAPVVRIGENEVSNVAALIDAAPHLKQPDAAEEAALAVNHLCEGSDFRVILNPDQFRETYLTKRAAEEDKPWDQNRPRLGDYGLADVDQIAVPATDGDQLIFFVRDQYTGLPYRVALKFGAEDADYQPLPTVAE
ncbi:MAG: hypothetical protein AB3N23_07850 [Paracoccaceae bacterium]